jgi:hypothetical protein
MALDSSSSGPSALRRYLIWAGVVLVVLLGSFVAGVAVGRRPVRDLTARVEQAEARADQAEARVADLDARLHAYRALSLLHATVADLDARNFGVANTRLDEVVAALDRVDRERFGAAAEELGTIRNALAGMDVQVATDLADQRTTLTGLARRLAEALGG